MFDLEKIKRESGIDPDDLARLETKVKNEFQSDEMGFELHFLRIIMAIKEDWISLEKALKENIEV